MRKLTLLFASLTLLLAGYLLAQTAVATTKVTAIAPNGSTQAIALSASPVGINSALAVRIESIEDGKVVGRLVTKVEGQWVEVKLGN